MAQTGLPGLVDSFIDSLDEVEDALEPLLTQSLQDSLAQVDGPLERARLLFWLAYTLHSCTWAFTKTAAVEPEEHGVTDELKRIQEYNRKITLASTKKKASDSSNGSQGGPAETDAKRLPLDKDAASRFIKAAIANQPDKPAPDSKFYTAATAVNDPLAGPGPHSRLNSLARASVKDTSENSVSATASEEEDEDLQVFTDAIQNKPSLSTKEQADQLGHNIVSSGNENGSSSDMPVESANKVAKKRKHMQHESKPIPTVLDALSGYDKAQSKKPKKKEDPSMSNAPIGEYEGSPKTSQQTGKKRRKQKKGDIAK